MVVDRPALDVHVFLTILLCHNIGYIELIRVLVIKHTSIWLRILPKMNAMTLLTLQMEETVKKHDEMIQQDSARYYL